MTESKFWLPKLIFSLTLVLIGFYFLFSEVTSREQEKPGVETRVLGVSAVAQPLQPILQPIIPVVQAKEIIPPTQDFSINIPVLMYHYVRSGVDHNDRIAYELSVTPEMLEKHLAYLNVQGYQTVSLDDLEKSLEEGLPLPPKSVVLTFDDGYRDFYTTAFPLLKKYNTRAVTFLIAGYSSYPNYMDWSMVKEIHQSGLVDIESHTLSHPELPKLSLEEQKREIFESKRILEGIINKKINYIAYPYGQSDDQVATLVSEAGYKLAFSTQPGPLLKRSEKFSLRRVNVSGFDNFEKFVEKLGQPKATQAIQTPEQSVSPEATPSSQTASPTQ